MSSSQYKYAAEILGAAGFGNIGPTSTIDDVMDVCRALGELIIDVGPLLRVATMASAVGSLRAAGIQPPIDADTAKQLIRAGIAEAGGSGGDAESWVTYGTTPDGSVVVDYARIGRKLFWVVARPPGARTHALQQQVVEIVEDLPGKNQWPLASLPWNGIPRVDDVQAALAADGAQALSFDLINVFRYEPEKQRHVVLDEPRGVWAVVLAMWIMASYLMDRFRYFPILLLEGPPERGKSRLGNAAAFLAYRGMNTATPTSATLFRNRSRHRVSLFMDVKDLPGRMLHSDDLADLLLGSFERDKIVSRVLRPDAETPPDEQKHFVVYGATVLATNIAVRADDPLVSRCLRIPLPEAGKQFVRDALRADDKLVLDLRARLVAWAARFIASGDALPEVDVRNLSGRIRDLGIPLLQVTRLVRPECYDVVLKLLQGTQRSARADASDSWEGKLIAALEKLRGGGLAPANEVGFQQVLQELTSGPDPIVWKDPDKGLGKLCKNIGITVKRRGSGSGGTRSRYIVIPKDSWADLLARYGIGSGLSGLSGNVNDDTN